MKPLQPGPKVRPMSFYLNGKRRKRSLAMRFISISLPLVMVLLSVGFFAVQKLLPSHASTVSKHAFQAGSFATINALQTITQIGSTANILDANGNQVMADPNPYKIAIAPSDLPPSLKAGDVLVSNIGNTDRGITLVKFAQQPGAGIAFNAPNAGVLGPSGLAFNNGQLLVANSAGNNVLVLNPDGTLFTTITSPLFNAPWSMVVGPQNMGIGMSTFFTANKLDGKILRIDVTASLNGFTSNVVQIGQYALNGKASKIDLLWMPTLVTANQTLADALLTIDPANNRLAAFANSSTLQAIGTPVTVFQGTPLNVPGGLALNPLNGNILVVNFMDNNLVELTSTGAVVGVKQIDPTTVDAQGNNSALFGVAATTDNLGNLKVFFTDDNTNTLDVLSV